MSDASTSIQKILIVSAGYSGVTDMWSKSSSGINRTLQKEVESCGGWCTSLTGCSQSLESLPGSRRVTGWGVVRWITWFRREFPYLDSLAHPAWWDVDAEKSPYITPHLLNMNWVSTSPLLKTQEPHRTLTFVFTKPPQLHQNATRQSVPVHSQYRLSNKRAPLRDRRSPPTPSNRTPTPFWS